MNASDPGAPRTRNARSSSHQTRRGLPLPLPPPPGRAGQIARTAVARAVAAGVHWRSARVNLAARLFQAGEVDRKRGHRGLSACKAVPAQRFRRQAHERATEMELVALIAKTREPCKQVIPDHRLVSRHCKNAVVLDRQRVEARIAGLIYMEPA